MEKRPPGAKPFKMDKYKGTGDPHLHLETFFSLCSSSGYSDAIACHTFQETLSEEALSWFLSLPPNSIDSFDQLSTSQGTRAPHSNSVVSPCHLIMKSTLP
ncbi:hypothetical protein ACLB2K_041085 [Fragaria x ananassa]